VPETTTDYRRAVAESNLERILNATIALLQGDPSPSFVDIARAAGVSRPTLYAHFPTREDLIEAAVTRAVEEAAGEVRAAELDAGPATEALDRLVRTLWRTLSRLTSLARVAMETLPPERRRRAHEVALEPVRQLIVRGQASGEFRTDQPPEWMVSVLYALLHGAADDVAGGRFDESTVGDLLSASALGALRPQAT
jgi:AcrR family transcriptional regulator